MTESSYHTLLETRLDQAETQIATMQERVAELTLVYQQMKQRALWTRVLLLLTALAAFFFLRSMGGR
jgi:hypothetical protein